MSRLGFESFPFDEKRSKVFFKISNEVLYIQKELRIYKIKFIHLLDP